MLLELGDLLLVRRQALEHDLRVLLLLLESSREVVRLLRDVLESSDFLLNQPNLLIELRRNSSVLALVVQDVLGANVHGLVEVLRSAPVLEFSVFSHSRVVLELISLLSKG